MAPRDLLLALAVMVVWGVNFMAIKWGVAEVPPLLLTALRYVVAVLPAIFFVRRPQVALGVLVAYGLFIGVGQFGFLFTAIHLGMPAGLASLVLQLQSFFTIGLAIAFLGERPRARNSPVRPWRCAASASSRSASSTARRSGRWR